jgi:hypothetical protein
MEGIELQVELRRAARNSGFSAPVVARLFVREHDACIDCEDHFTSNVWSDDYAPMARECLPEARRLASWVKERFSILNHSGAVFVYIRGEDYFL